MTVAAVLQMKFQTIILLIQIGIHNVSVAIHSYSLLSV
jgi:hypothetical protein